MMVVYPSSPWTDHGACHIDDVTASAFLPTDCDHPTAVEAAAPLDTYIQAPT